MAMARSLTASSNLGSLHLPPRYSSYSRITIPHRLLDVSASKLGYGFSANQTSKSPDSARRLPYKINAKMSNDLQSVAPKSSKPISPNWVMSAMLSILSLVLPGWKTQLQMLLKLEDEVEKVVENTAEAIENIAEATEKVIEEVEHDLPADSKLKDAVLMIEHATKEAQKDAELAIDLIHKVDEIKEEVEAVVEPVINPVEFLRKET